MVWHRNETILAFSAMKVVVLSAGTGSRLWPHTSDRPKSMVKFIGRPLIDYQLRVFQEYGLDDISIVVGHCSESVIAPNCELIYNPQFLTTNMVVSLFMAEKVFDGTHDVIVSYGDIVFEQHIIRRLLDSDGAVSVVIDVNWHDYWLARMPDLLNDIESLVLSDDRAQILEIGGKVEVLSEVKGQYIGLIKIRKDVAHQLPTLWRALQQMETYNNRAIDALHMTDLLTFMIENSIELTPIDTKNCWLEFDTVEDLELYERLHRSGTLSFFRVP
jgi:choline kinase